MSQSAVLRNYSRDPSNILAILHDFQNQDERNHLSEDDLAEVASYLNVPMSWVFGVATYYSMFSVTPRGRHVIRVCRSPVCHVEGTADLITRIADALGISPGETTADGEFSLEYTECLGRCAAAPTVMIDDKIFGGEIVQRLESALDTFKTQ